MIWQAVKKWKDSVGILDKQFISFVLQEEWLCTSLLHLNLEMSKCCICSHEGRPKDKGRVALSLGKTGIFSGVQGKIWLG